MKSRLPSKRNRFVFSAMGRQPEPYYLKNSQNVGTVMIIISLTNDNLDFLMIMFDNISSIFMNL
jgi:hypothetical protein